MGSETDVQRWRGREGRPTQRATVTLEDVLLLEAVGEKEFERIMRARRKKAKRAAPPRITD